jgi:hypothetical protein
MSNYSGALERAIDRDIRDEERLMHIATLVAGWLDALAPDAHDMEHPDAKWHPEDLIIDLQGHALSIAHELKRLRSGPPVVDDEDY